jgi:hypothetical protein
MLSTEVEEVEDTALLRGIMHMFRHAALSIEEFPVVPLPLFGVDVIFISTVEFFTIHTGEDLS